MRLRRAAVTRQRAEARIGDANQIAVDAVAQTAVAYCTNQVVRRVGTGVYRTENLVSRRAAGALEVSGHDCIAQLVSARSEVQTTAVAVGVIVRVGMIISDRGVRGRHHRRAAGAVTKDAASVPGRIVAADGAVVDSQRRTATSGAGIVNTTTVAGIGGIAADCAPGDRQYSAPAGRAV